MNTTLLEKPAPAKVAVVPEEAITRLPVAAGLLPYGLSLASLLNPKS